MDINTIIQEANPKTNATQGAVTQPQVQVAKPVAQPEIPAWPEGVPAVGEAPQITVTEKVSPMVAQANKEEDLISSFFNYTEDDVKDEYEELPVGEFLVQATKMKINLSQEGKPYWSLTLKVVDGEASNRIENVMLWLTDFENVKSNKRSVQSAVQFLALSNGIKDAGEKTALNQGTALFAQFMKQWDANGRKEFVIDENTPIKVGQEIFIYKKEEKAYNFDGKQGVSIRKSFLSK